MPITIEQAIIDSLEGRVKTHEGRGVLLNLTIPDRGHVEGLVLRNDFPCGCLPKMIGSPIDVLLQTSGDQVVCMVLPLQYQGSKATSTLLGKLVASVDKEGQVDLDSLPIARRLKSGDRPEPHPLAEKLDRLLEQSDSDEDSETQTAKPWNRREWEAAQMEEAQRQAAEDEADDPRLWVDDEEL
ncbi:hypothetical protein MITS9508_01126 [Synechococcus sp. MIT S9508]|nr:hypothetical protein MITS9508_01126 [Synechococcus sp. MIT S9508]